MDASWHPTRAIPRDVPVRDSGLVTGAIRRWETVPSPAVVAVTVTLVALITALDFITGPKLDMMMLYFVPVFCASWVLARWAGVTTAAACALGAFPQYLRDGFSDALFNTVGRALVLSLVAVLLAGLRSMLVREQQRAGTDPLTGAMNRRAFLERLELECARSRRRDEPLTVMFLDLDGFKELNDTRGHAFGDAVLRSVGDALRSAVRATDAVARIGGDEFAVCLPEASHAGARQAAERIEASLADIPGGSRPVSASIGVATFLAPLHDTAAMLQWSDRLMYRAKQAPHGKIAAEIVLDATDHRERATVD